MVCEWSAAVVGGFSSDGRRVVDGSLTGRRQIVSLCSADCWWVVGGSLAVGRRSVGGLVGCRRVVGGWSAVDYDRNT